MKGAEINKRWDEEVSGSSLNWGSYIPGQRHVYWINYVEETEVQKKYRDIRKEQEGNPVNIEY